MHAKKPIKGFTLIELLIVIGIIAILAAFTFVALNPLARFADSRNAQRWSDVNALLSAIKLYQVDHQGQYLQAVTDIQPDNYYQIGLGYNGITCNYPEISLDQNLVDLKGLVDQGYLPSIPTDPSFIGTDQNPAESYQTHYYLWKDSKGFISVGACNEEQGTRTEMPIISVTR